MSSSGKNTVRLKDIAASLGISKTAVSLALKDSARVSKDMKLKVRVEAKRLGYKAVPLVSNVMASMRSKKNAPFLESIVLVNASKLRNVEEQFPIFSKYIVGVNAEANKMGYSVYRVWLYDDALDCKKLQSILRARNIRGGIIIGQMSDNVLPSSYDSVWKNFHFVSAGLKIKNHQIDFVSADKFLIAQYVTRKIIAKGFRRPCLVLHRSIDNLVEGRFSGGFLSAQLELPELDRIPPFLDVDEAKKRPELFLDFIGKHKPDVIFSLSSLTSLWLENNEIGACIPKSIVRIETEYRGAGFDWVAVDKNYELVGRLAVRKLFDILNSPSSKESTKINTGTIVQPHWNKNPLSKKGGK